MVFRPIFVSLILLASNIFAQDSNSPYFFTFLTTSNEPSCFGAATQSPDKVEKKPAKPQGVTLPDGTFIANKPTKASIEKKNELEIHKSYVDNPKGSTDMIDQGTKSARSTSIARGRVSKLQRVGGGVVVYAPIKESSVQDAEVKYWITSTGKRHNSSCRYYGNTKSGRYTTSRDEGAPCGKCGG
jgi:hypothetical protein